ncbi:hypothetical protein ACFC8C_13175, partial [Enterococcus faecalis]|uniref:hypothetical protein n=1 Tax=Enterococcus faecalis TaxID=1351 RepID=UPI0035DCC8ED
LHRFDQRSNGFGLTAGRNDEILTRWNLEKILTNRVRGIDSNPGFGLTAGRNDEILTRWNLEKILTNRVRGIDSNPSLANHQL